MKVFPAAHTPPAGGASLWLEFASESPHAAASPQHSPPELAAVAAVDAVRPSDGGERELEAVGGAAVAAARQERWPAARGSCAIRARKRRLAA